MIEQLDYSGIEFPVTAKQYNKIEKQNNININVFGYEEKQFCPIHISSEKNSNCMNLLLITEEEKNHYVLIKDFNKLMYNQTKHKAKKYFCMYCLQNFSTEKTLNKHSEICMVYNGNKQLKCLILKTIYSNLKIIRENYLFHLLFMLILKRLLKKYQIAEIMMRNHILQNIKDILIVPILIN